MGQSASCDMADKNFFGFSAKDAKENEISFSQFKGKVVLVVNVASK